MPLKVSGKTGKTGQALRSRIDKTNSAQGQLELATRPAVWSRPENQGGLELVYHCSDGNIGRIDPAPMESGRA